MERIGIVAAIVFAAFLSACATVEEHESSLAVGKTGSSIETTLSEEGSLIGNYRGTWSRPDGTAQGEAQLSIFSVSSDGKIKASIQTLAPLGLISCSQKHFVSGEVTGETITLYPEPGNLCGRLINLTRSGNNRLVGTYPSSRGANDLTFSR